MKNHVRVTASDKLGFATLPGSPVGNLDTQV